MKNRFDLDSLRLVFGTYPIKNSKEDNEKISEAIDLRKRKIYDFSETKVKADELLSNGSMDQHEMESRIANQQNSNNQYVIYLKPKIENIKSSHLKQ